MLAGYCGLGIGMERQMSLHNQTLSDAQGPRTTQLYEKSALPAQTLPSQPPPLPPRYYWRPEYETPPGHQAIEDWSAGFRAGAGVARASGLRELVTVPASTALPSRTPMQQPVAPAASKQAHEKEETLPAPRTAAPDAWRQSSEQASPGQQLPVSRTAPPEANDQQANDQAPKR